MLNKKLMKRLLPFAILYFVLFMILPIMFYIDEGFMQLVPVILVTVNPLICYTGSMTFGVMHGFDWQAALVGPIFFLLMMFIYYNSSAASYLLIYTVVSIAGLGIGAVIKKSFRRR